MARQGDRRRGAGVESMDVDAAVAVAFVDDAARGQGPSFLFGL